ncbi:ABC transporter substrate-binding protein [Shewanella sp.]|uniref:ABC transporter substrate-binding protein n=1 Tax=Shewanella sp. TaxID=50422 RepID=UPI0035630B63
MRRIGFGLTLLIVFALYWLYEISGTEHLSSPKITIAVSSTPLSSPFILAEKYGFFRKHGVDVQLKLYHGGHRCFDALVNGEVDLATSSESVVMYNAFKRNDFSVIATFVTSDNDVKLLGRRHSGIQSPTDIADHRVGMIRGTASEYFFYSALNLHSVDSSGITPVYLAPEQLSQALLNNDVDVVSLWEPYAHQLAQKLKDEGVQLSTKGLYRLSFNLISKRLDVQKHRAAHEALLRALDDAIELTDENPTAAQDIVSTYLDIPESEVASYWPDYHFHLTLDKTLQLDLLSQAHWAIASGYVAQSTAPDFRDFIDSTALGSFRTGKGNPGKLP